MKNFVYDRSLAQHLFDKKSKEYNNTAPNKSAEIAALQSNGVRFLAATDVTKVVENSRRAAESMVSKADFSEEYAAAFKVLGMESVFSLTQKTSSPNALMATSVNLTLAYNAAREKMTAKEVLAGIDAFERHMAGEINAIGLDIESISGDDANGITRFDNITEFAASTFEPEKMKDGSVSFRQTNKVSHLVAQSEEKVAEYAALLDKKGVSTIDGSIDTIMMKHFARLGHLDSKINYDASTGSHMGELVGQDEAGLLTVENIKRGMARNSEMLKEQQLWAAKNGGVMAWEKGMVDTLVGIQTATGADNAVLFGHNLRGFDIPNLQQIIKRKMAENPAFAAYAASRGYINFDPNNNKIYDSLIASRLADRGGNFARMLYGNKQIPTDKTGRKQKIFSQEAISEILGVAPKDAAHQALIDLETAHKVATSSIKLSGGKKISLTSALKGFIKEENVKSVTLGGDKQLLHMTRGIDRWSLGKNLFGFNIDPLDGKIHTHNGYEIAENGIANQSWTASTSLAKKGANYSASIFSLGSNPEMQKAFSTMYPGMDNNELYMLRLTPDTYESAPNKNLLKTENMPSFIVGTKEDLEEHLNGITIAIGEKGRTGGWRPIEEGLKLTASIDAAGVPSPQEMLQKIRAEGAEVQANDTAAWMIRRRSPSQFRAMGQVHKYIEEQTAVNQAAIRADRIANGIANTSEEDILSEARKVTLAQLKAATMGISSKTAKGKALTMAEQTDAINAIGSLANSKGKINRGTYDNIIASTDYFSSIAPHMEELFKVIDGRLAGIENQYERAAYERFLFNEGMTKLHVAAANILQRDPDKKAAVIRAYEKSRYEVDISSMLRDRLWSSAITGTNSPRGNILNIDLNRNGSYKLMDALGQINGVSSKTYNSDPEIKKQLIGIASIIMDNGDGNSDLKSIIAKPDAANEVIARTITASLRIRKEKDSKAGILGEKTFEQVIGPSELAAVKLDDYKNILQELNSNVYDATRLGNMTTSEGAIKEARKFAEEFMTFGTHNSKEWTKFGFNERQMTYLENLQRTTLEDSKRFAETLFSGLQKSGFGITYDAKLGMAQITDKRGRYYDISSLIPKLRFRDGTFYTEIGRNNVDSSLELTVGYGKRLSETRLSSHIGTALGNSYDLDGMINRKLRDGEDPIESIFAHLRHLRSEVASHSGISFSPQDKKRQFELGIGGFIDALPEMLKTHKFEGLPEADKDRLIAIADKSKNYWSHEKLSDEAKHLIARNYHVFAQALEDVPNGDVKTAVKWLGVGSKASSMERGYLNADPLEFGLSGFDDMKRDIENIHLREINATKAKAALKKYGKDMAHVKVGNPLTTALGRGMTSSGIEGFNIETATELVVDRAYVAADSYKKKITEKVNELSVGADEETREMLKRAGERLKVGGQVIEGGAVADVRLITNVMDQIDYQKVSYEKNLSYELQNNLQTLDDLKELRDVVPKFKYNEATGRIEFTYSKGRYIGSAEEALKLAGFGDSVEHVIAKDPGVLKLGFFAKGRGLMASAEDVAEAVAKKAGYKVTNTDEFMQLAGQIYDINFFVQKAKKNILRKTAENLTEKHETYFAAFGLGGSGNKKIISTLNKLGFGDLVEKQTILSEELFSEFANAADLAYGHTAKLAGAKKLTEAMVREAVVGDGKYTSMEDFQKALWEEYIAPSKLLRHVTGGDYAVSSNPYKHLSRSDAIRSGILSAIDQRTKMIMNDNPGFSAEEAYRQANARVATEAAGIFRKDFGKKTAIHFDEKTGLIVFDEMLASDGGGINYTEANRYFSETAPGWKSMYEDGSVSKASISSINEWEGMTSRTDFYEPEHIDWSDPTQVALHNQELISKGTKVSDRELNMLDFRTYNQKYIDEVHRSVDSKTFKALLGDKVDFVDGKAVLKQEYNGQSILKPLTDSYRSQMFYQEGETELTKNYIASNKGSAYLERFLDENYMKEAGYGKISVKKAQQLYSAQMGVAAVVFNQHDITLDQLQKAGGNSWQKINIGDLDRSTGGDYEYLIKSENSLLRKNVLLNLRDDDFISDELISKMGNKTNNGMIAIGRPLDQRVGDNAILREHASSVNKIIIARNEIEAAGEDEAKKQKAEDKLVRAVGEFHERQNAVVLGKNGLIGNAAKVELPNSFSGKASIMALSLDSNLKVIDKSDEAKALQKIKIGGKSLLDHADEGKMFDVKLVSREALEKQGMFDEKYMRSILDDNVLKTQVDTLDGAEQQLAKMKTLAAEKYRTEGFTSMTHRFPTIYLGSMRPVQTYLSDDVESHQVISMFQGAILSKTDSDGDLEYLARVMGQINGKSFDSLQMKKMAAADQINGGGAIRAAQTDWFHAAAHENKIARRLVEEDLRLTADAEKTVLANSLSDYIYPHSDRLVKPRELAAHEETFQKWHEEALNLASDRKEYAGQAREVIAEQLKNDKGAHTALLREAMASATEGERHAVTSVLNSIEERATAIGKGRRSSAGEISLAVFQLRKTREMAKKAAGYNPTEYEQGAFEAMMEAAEEGFLSPKHSEAEIIENAGIINQFNTARKNLQRGLAGSEEAMVDLFEKNFAGRMRAINVQRVKGISDHVFSSEELAEESSAQIRAGVKMMSSMYGTMDNIEMFNNSTYIAASKLGLGSRAAITAMMVPEEAEGQMLAAATKAINKGIGFDFGELRASSGVRTVDLDEAYQAAQEQMAERPSIAGESILNAIKHGFGDISLGSGLAKGALGLAAGLMVAGFVGGNPARPADRHAEEEHEDEDAYALPALTNTNQMVAQRGPQAGYIININARTDQGRQHAERAIKQAMSSQSRSKVNIAMNIRDDSGNINDSNIERMIEGALR